MCQRRLKSDGHEPVPTASWLAQKDPAHASCCMTRAEFDVCMGLTDIRGYRALAEYVAVGRVCDGHWAGLPWRYSETAMGQHYGHTIRFWTILAPFSRAIGSTFRYLLVNRMLQPYFHQITESLSATTPIFSFFPQITDSVSARLHQAALFRADPLSTTIGFLCPAAAACRISISRHCTRYPSRSEITVDRLS